MDNPILMKWDQGRLKVKVPGINQPWVDYTQTLYYQPDYEIPRGSAGYRTMQNLLSNFGAKYEIKQELKLMQIETELKVLLTNTALLLDKLNNPSVTYEETQLNHYFDTNGDLKALASKFDLDLTGHSDISIRTRETNQKTVYLVVKSSMLNGDVSRFEQERVIDGSISDLDQSLIGLGFDYLSKWSRERSVFELDGYTLCLDTNAGYGTVAEFEIVSNDRSEALKAEAFLQILVSDLGLTVLSEDRLKRMFNFYNRNWSTFYQTNNTFTIY